MKRRGNHIAVTLAIATMLVLSSCTPTGGFHPVSLLVGEGSQSTVISTVLLKLPGRLLNTTLAEVESRFQKDKQKHKKDEQTKTSNKVLSLPIHTRIANPIPLKKDVKIMKEIKDTDNNSHTSTSGNTKLEKDSKSNTDIKTQDSPICCQLM
jgi:hypothetical protein